ncbi:MAG: SOS response-associated peptidase family protein [Bradyrhizobium sp.]
MCGRYRNMKGWPQLRADLDFFHIVVDQPALNLPMQEQVRPTQSAPIVCAVGDGSKVTNAHWWLVPWVHKGTLTDRKATTFNARAETVSTSRSLVVWEAARSLLKAVCAARLTCEV